MSAFFVQKTSEEHLASLKSPSRQNPQIQETNFGNSVSCNGYAENGVIGQNVLMKTAFKP